MGDLRNEWRLQEIDRKATEASRRLYEIDSLRSQVVSTEHSIREFRAEIDGLRSELETQKNKLNNLME